MRPHEAGIASGLINTSRQIGGALGIAWPLIGLVATLLLPDRRDRAREAPAEAAASSPT